MKNKNIWEGIVYLVSQGLILMKSVSQVPLYLQALSLHARFAIRAVLLYRASKASAQFTKSLFAYRGLLIAFV